MKESYISIGRVLLLNLFIICNDEVGKNIDDLFG